MFTYKRLGVMSYEVFHNGVSVGTCFRMRDETWAGHTNWGTEVQTYRQSRGSIAAALLRTTEEEKPLVEAYNERMRG